MKSIVSDVMCILHKDFGIFMGAAKYFRYAPFTPLKKLVDRRSSAFILEYDLTVLETWGL